MHASTKLLLWLWLPASLFAKDPKLAPAVKPPPPPPVPAAEVVLREIRYEGKLSDTEARFVAELDLESLNKTEAALPLFEGEVAVLSPKLPANLRLLREKNVYRLLVAKPGRYLFKLDLVAKIHRTENVRQLSFAGPSAAIASVTAQAVSEGMELQLLSGTPQADASGDRSRVRGFLGADRNVSLSWQSRTMEAARPALLTCETTVAAQITPTVVKYTTHLRYDILQGKASKLVVNLPAAQAITRIQGEQIRDWQVKPEGGRQTLTIEFVKPAEKAYALTILSEQTIDISAAGIFPPQPQGVERETGSLTVTAEDVLVELDAVSGLRQMNAPAGAWATYQFFGRNTFALAVKLRRIEPVIQTADRVGVRLEETRLLVSHSLTVIVEKAGIYALELAPQPGFAVADVHGEGVDDWKMKEGRLLLSFASRALGARKLEVQLEQALKTVPGEITIQPLRAALAVKETAQIGAAAAAGIQLKTAELAGVREIPASTLAVCAGEALSYAADQADWTVKLSAERLAARLTAEIFNLVTIGDGLVGGSATLRYGILNQGVQEFRVRVPAGWKNVEFTGPNIRRKEQQGTNWTVSLQEKAWGGYTLVITYDAQFDPHKATLPVGGAHALGVERESGTVAITSAANVQLSVKTASETLRRVDESELSATDRALISRPVLQAFQYEGDQYELAVDVARFTELPVLEAVADRTQITTVLTEEGQMLTQASFMVKNNDKQFQRFTLPPGATFWGCYVRNQPVKAERDGEALLVPLPRGSNRDEAFAVDLVYAQKIDSLKSLASRRIALEAPRTDVPNTYNEWELFVPATHRLASFAGNMIVARGTTYELRDAWKAFLRYYQSRQSAAIQWVITAGIMFFLALLLIAAVRRGVRGALVVLGVFALLAVLAGMTLPALNSTGMKSASRAGAAIDVDETVGLSPSESSKESADNSTAALTPTARVASASGKGAVQPGQAAFTVAPAAGGPAATIASSGAVAIAPVVAGLRPIHIDIPRTGERFVFTKVLNVNGESLKIETLAMAATTYQLRQSGAQLAAFLLGALVLGWQFRRPNRQSFLLAAGLALVFGSGGSFLLAQRQLHFAFIVAAPTLAGLLLIGVLWSFWRASRRARPQAPGTDPLPVGPGTVPPVAASLLFLLWALSGAQAAKPEAQDTNSVTITSASYQVAVREQAALVEAVITLSASKPGQKVALFGDDVAVQEFSSSPKDAQLLREGRSVSVRLPKKGVATVTLKFLIKHTGDVTRRQLGFAIPPSLTTKLNATLEEPDAAVEAPTAVSFKTTTTDKQTRVEAIIGAGERVELNWTPRVKRTAEIAATIFCQNATLLTFGGGVINAQVTLDYQISQGELRQARVRLPAGQKLMRVEGDSLRTWKISEENDGQTLVVDLARGVTPTWRLILELEQLLTALPASVKLETPHALDVKRETGLVALGPATI